MSERPEIETLASRTAYANRWMRVREDQVRRADGSTGIYGVVERSDFAVVIPVEPDGAIHMVEQYRYPVRGRWWELPQGAWEHAPDADPLALARGELREETGLIAERMTHIGHLFLAAGICTQGYDIFVAEGLTQVDAALEVEEQGLIARRFPRETIEAMIAEERLKDGVTIAALALFDRHRR